MNRSPPSGILVCGQLAHWSGYMAGLPCSPSTPPHTHTKGRLPSYPSQPHLLSTYCVSGHVPHIGPLARAGRWSSEAGLGKPAPQDCHCSVRQTGKERSAPSVVSLPLGRGLSLSGTFSGPEREQIIQKRQADRKRKTRSQRGTCVVPVCCVCHTSACLCLVRPGVSPGTSTHSRGPGQTSVAAERCNLLPVGLRP